MMPLEDTEIGSPSSVTGSYLKGRNHLWRFLPGAEWKKLPDCFKGPNHGRRLTPRRTVSIACLQCGKEVERHRRSARYCSDECRRRAQLERDAMRKGKSVPAQRARGAERRRLALERGIRLYGTYGEYVRHLAENKRKRHMTKVDRLVQKELSPQEEWINYHRSGLALEDKSQAIRYARVFRPQTAG